METMAAFAINSH